MNHINAYNKLVEFAKENGFVVQYGDDSEILFNHDYSRVKNKGLITIKRHRNKVLELYDLLHELGHYICRKSWKAYQQKYHAVIHGQKRTQLFYIQSIHEEYVAWDNGLQLAKSLKIPISEHKYNQYAANAIYTYVHHFGTRKRTNSGKRITR